MYLSEPVVSIENATVTQGTKVVLDNVSLSVEKGEMVYLIGKTGSGKSSLLKTLYADLPLVSGKVRVAGMSVDGLKKKEIPTLRRKIGIIFQAFELLTDRSIAENLLFVMRATGWTDNSKMRNRIQELLLQVGLYQSEDKMPHQLSGGEQQRVAIARALINEPLILFADEPTGNLDPETAEEILSLFHKINNSGTAVLMATHNHQFLEKFPARRIVCHNQKLIHN